MSGAELQGRRIADILSREIRLPLEQALALVFGSGRAIQLALPLAGRERPHVAVDVRGAGPGWAVLETGTLPEKGVGSWRRVLFDHLNRIGAGATYVYDRSPSVALNLSILLGFEKDILRTRARSGKAMVHPEDLARFVAHRRRLGSAPDGEVAGVTVRMRHSDGDWRWIQIREQALSRDERGRVRQVLGQASDVSEHYALAEATSRLTNAVLTAEMDERRRIARELHDSMAQHLVVIDLTMSRLERDIPEALPADAVSDIRAALKAAHREIRTLSYLLHPPDLERLGLGESIEKFALGFGSRTGLVVTLDLEPMHRLEPVVELTLFRIVQEALMNVHRHARAQAVEVSLRESRGEIAIEVSDDGIGVSESHAARLLEQQGAGVGLQGIRARVEKLEGRLDIRSSGDGFTLVVRLPGAVRSRAGLAG